MERARKALSGERAQTNASLDAERAGLTGDDAGTLSRAQRLADDRIERDRCLADAQLSKFRARVDGMLARERADTGRAWSSDQGRKAERDATDALLNTERERADALVAEGRREHEEGRTRRQEHRQDTDDDLLAERSGADVTLAILGETQSALGLAQRQQDRRADVLAMVTHDLRTPLTIIAMNAQNIEATTAEPATRESAAEMSLVGARMERLLVDLLDVVRIESGVFHMVKRPHDVSTFMAEIARHYGPLFEARGLELVVRGIGARFVVPFDHDRIVQVLSNLLGNAMKFTPRGGTVQLHTRPLEDQQVEFLVRDNGPGIPPEALPHVFERFWQIESKSRRGLGLGLNICEKIVEEHGGRIWVDSTVGKGAAFHFTLPTTGPGPD